jgi:hypothetical protein
VHCATFKKLWEKDFSKKSEFAEKFNDFLWVKGGGSAAAALSAN